MTQKYHFAVQYLTFFSQLMLWSEGLSPSKWEKYGDKDETLGIQRLTTAICVLRTTVEKLASDEYRRVISVFSTVLCTVYMLVWYVGGVL